jgi:ubiquinone/menaquinone biosynthesis C-methylase UbiE
MSDERRFGVGKGDVFPASQARLLTNPVRHLMHPPKRLARRAGLSAEDRVLELGCGPGWFSPALAKRSGRLHLADLQPEMLALARRRAPGATATAVDALAMPFADGSFDAVVLAAVLGEIPDPPGAVREIARVLRSGGRLAVLETRTDPDFTSFAKLSEMAAAAALRPERRIGRLAGYTAIFTLT